MIISRGRSYIFLHQPKTGGTSLALALEERAMKDDIMLGDTPKARKRRRRLHNVQAAGRLWKHATLADIDGLITPQEAARMFTFTMVRNPWDRMVSYYHWLRDQAFDHPAVSLARTVDFAGFVQSPATQTSLRRWPAARYMRDATGAERCSVYIRLEHFATDAAPLFDHLGFALHLPRTNASARAQQYQAYYTPELEQIIARCCAKDIARFGYRFG